MKPGTSKDRALQIELLRTRAALERQSLQRGVRQLGQGLSPGHLVQNLMPAISTRSVANWGLQLLTLSRRYPLLISTASTGLSLLGRRGRWIKLLAGAALGWQLLRGRHK